MHQVFTLTDVFLYCMDIKNACCGRLSRQRDNNMKDCVLTVLILLRTVAEASLVARLQDTSVVIGQPAQLFCSTTYAKHPIWWDFQSSAPGSKRVWIYQGEGVVVNEFEKRGFWVDQPGAGYHNLRIRNASYKDAGRYTCKDKGGLGPDNATAELVVTDSRVACEYNASSELLTPSDLDCSPGPDHVRMTCSLAYSGHAAPVLQWRQDGGDDVNVDVIADVINTTTEHSARYTLLTTVKARMNGARYTCGAVLRGVSLSAVHDWISPVINVFSISATDEPAQVKKPCPVVTNMKNCTFYDRLDIVHRSIPLGIEDKPSEGDFNTTYTCVTECTVRGRTCRHSSKPFTVTVGLTLQTRPWLQIVPPVGALLLLLAAALACWRYRGYAVCVRWKRVRLARHCSQGDDSEETGGFNFTSDEEEEEDLNGLSDQIPMTVRRRRTSSWTGIKETPRNVSRLHTNGRAVSGVAALGKQLYIACRHTNSITVYNSTMPFDEIEKIKVSGLQNAYDMAACPKNQCLYIVDENGAVFRINAQKKVDKLTNIIVKDPCTISVNQEGSLIVLHNEYRPNRYGDGFNLYVKLCIYCPTASCAVETTRTTVYLPAECSASVQHAVELRPTQFLICHGKPSTVSQISSISGIHHDSVNLNLPKVGGYPGHLALDDGGNVYLASRKRVILLNTKNLAEIELEKGLSYIKNPTRLCVLENDVLLIGTHHDGAFIYEMRPKSSSKLM